MLVTDINDDAYAHAFGVLGFAAWTAAVPTVGDDRRDGPHVSLGHPAGARRRLRARIVEASMASSWRQDHAAHAARTVTPVPDEDDQHQRPSGKRSGWPSS